MSEIISCDSPQITDSLKPADTILDSDTELFPDSNLTTLDKLISWVANIVRKEDTTIIANPLSLLEILAELRETPGLDKFKVDIAPYIEHIIIHNDFKLHATVNRSEIIVKFLTRIWFALGKIVDSATKIVSRQELIGNYIGHTNQKTRHILTNSEVSVLYIDDAYNYESAAQHTRYGHCMCDDMDSVPSVTRPFVQESLQVIHDHVQSQKFPIVVINHQQRDRHFPSTFE